jgi:hypothetical protein
MSAAITPAARNETLLGNALVIEFAGETTFAAMFVDSVASASASVASAARAVEPVSYAMSDTSSTGVQMARP